MKAFFAGVMKLVDFFTRIMDAVKEKRRKARETKRRKKEAEYRERYARRR